MSEEQAKPEILPGDLITGPGVYMSRSNNPVEVRDCGNGYWEAAWEHGDLRYHSSGERVGVSALDDPYQLIRWVGPLAEDIPTTSEQLADTSGRDIVRGLVLQVADLIEREEEIEPQPEPQSESQPQPEPEPQAADTPATGYTPPEGWRVLAVGELLQEGDQIVQLHDGKRFPTERAGQYVCETQRYIRPIEPEPVLEPEPQPEPCEPCDSRDNQADYTLPEGCRNDGGWSSGVNGTEPESWPVPQPQPESDAELRIRLLMKQCNDTQAETIKRLMAEARDLNMEIGGLQRQLVQRDARIRDLETMHAAATKAVVDAGKQNDALRLQVQNRQQEYERQKSRIEFLETLDAGNAVAIADYRAMVQKLQGLVDTARQQLEAAATERDELRAAIDAADKQLDQKDAQIRDLRIELDAAQQVPQPVSDEEREQIWDEATEAAGRQVVRWLRPLTLALHRQPDERFSRFMALTLSVLPDLLPELLGYAVEDETEGDDCEE